MTVENQAASGATAGTGQRRSVIVEGRSRTVAGVARKMAGKRAQQRAYARLKQAHEAEYRRYYLEEIATEGFTS